MKKRYDIFFLSLFTFINNFRFLTVSIFIIGAVGNNVISTSWFFQIPYSLKREELLFQDFDTITLKQESNNTEYTFQNFKVFQNECIIRGFSDFFPSSWIFINECEGVDITITASKYFGPYNEKVCKQIGVFKGGSCIPFKYIYLCPKELFGMDKRLENILKSHSIEFLNEIKSTECEFFLRGVHLREHVIKHYVDCYELIDNILRLRSSGDPDMNSFEQLILKYISSEEIENGLIGDDCFERYLTLTENAWRILLRIHSLIVLKNRNFFIFDKICSKSEDNFEKYISYIKKCFKIQIADVRHLGDVEIFYKSSSDSKGIETKDFYILSNIVFIPCLKFEVFKTWIFYVRTGDSLYIFNSEDLI